MTKELITNVSEILGTTYKIYLVELREFPESYKIPHKELVDFCLKIMIENGEFWTFRGVEYSRLRTVLSTGIDVVPSNAVFYTADLDKSFEYGQWPKLILALHGSSVKLTYKEIPVDTPESEAYSIRSEYPTVLVSQDGNSLWCSRLNSDDPRVATDYEIAYARWFDGNSMEALKAIFVFSLSNDHALKADLTSAVNGK